MTISKASTLGGVILALGVLASAPAALADHDLYPAGWNKEPDPNVPTPLFDFRAGWGWGDYQRYWPDQALRTSPKSRPFHDMPELVFDFRAGWGWGDYQRYWPDQALRTSPKSRPLPDVPVIYAMTPGGERFHEVH